MQVIHAHFGGQTVALGCIPGPLADALHARFEAFLGTAAEPLLTVAVDTAPHGPFDTSDVTIARDGNNFALATGGARAVFAPGHRLLNVTCTPPRAGDDSAETARCAVENLLRPALQYALVAAEAGLLVHAASATFDGRSLLCPGVSGAGKSTTSRLFHAAAGGIYSDDLSFLTCAAGAWSACGSPFFGGAADLPRTLGTSPLAGIFFIAHGARTELTRLTPARAAMKLATHVPYAQVFGEALPGFLTTIAAVTAAAPAWDAPLVPNAAAVTAIRAAAGV